MLKFTFATQLILDFDDLCINNSIFRKLVVTKSSIVRHITDMVFDSDVRKDGIV